MLVNCINSTPHGMLFSPPRWVSHVHAPTYSTDSGVRVYGIHTKSLRSPIVAINWVKSSFQLYTLLSATEGGTMALTHKLRRAAAWASRSATGFYSSAHRTARDSSPITRLSHFGGVALGWSAGQSDCAQARQTRPPRLARGPSAYRFVCAPVGRACTVLLGAAAAR